MAVQRCSLLKTIFSDELADRLLVLLRKGGRGQNGTWNVGLHRGKSRAVKIL
jgi:hypothetical protein